ncbi:MAG: glycosyltransferase family 4 protein [Methanobacteriales archaeon]|nr:glycosyltransferase family 4 protein [Methanobacteriales archaeon]
MRVLNVLMQNYIGGPQIRAVSVAKGLLDKGVETVICAPASDENPLKDYATKNGLEFESIFMPSLREFKGIKDVFINLIWILSIPLTIIHAVMIIKRRNIDLVHVNGILNFQATIAAYICNKKVVWHLMSSLYPAIIIRVMMPIIKKIADEIIVIAKGLAEYYMGASDEYTLIYEPVDLEVFNRNHINKDEIESLRSSLGLSPEDTVGVCVANINPVKGYEYLLRAVAKAVDTAPRFKFLIVGDVPTSQKEYFKRLLELVKSLKIEDQVLFLGRMDNIAEILAVSDFFVLSSIAEGTPISIIEAMAMGKPIIATDVGAINEQVIHGRNGFLVPPASWEKLGDKIIEMVLNEDLRNSMGRESIKLVKKFSLDKCLEKHLKVYMS